MLALLLVATRGVWETDDSQKRLVLDVGFETARDYDITSAYAVRGWNTTEGKMKITCPSTLAKHGGRFGMEVRIVQPYTRNFHAQFSLPHFMPRMKHSAYQLTFWGRVASTEATPEVTFLDVDEGYDWVGGAEVTLTSTWQHIAMEPVFTKPEHQGHEIQISFLVGMVAADFFFDDIQLFELDVPSPPPPSPPPPPFYLLWLDGEGGPKGAQTVVKAGVAQGSLEGDLSSKEAAHNGKYGYHVEVGEAFEEDFYGMLSLPPFLVTDHERLYTLSFWAKATGNPKPRPHITFQDEDNDYAYISGERVQLSNFWHQYEVRMVVPYKLRGHNVVTNLMLGGYVGTYDFDEFKVTDAGFVSPPPSPPVPPPSPPPNVLLQLTLESYERGSINSQAWPEGEMQLVVQSPSAAHSGQNGLFLKVVKAFDVDWHAQLSLRPFTPPDTQHGYIFSFWGRMTSVQQAGMPGHEAAPPRPKVVFQDADDEYTPLKQVAVPLNNDWNLFQVDLSIPRYRFGHAIVVSFWVGEAVGSFAFDDLEVTIVPLFSPPPPPPPLLLGIHASPPPPGVVALLGFEGGDDGVSSQRTANNGSWTVSVPDPRAAHTGGQGLYVQVERAWKWAPLAQVLLPRYVPRAGRETLLHLSFWARTEKLHANDPTPTVSVAFLDLHKNYEQLGLETVTLTRDWQMHYVVVDLKTDHVGHSIRPYLYVGMHAGIYLFDDFEYKEIEIEDGMEWLRRAPERIKNTRMGKFRLTFLDNDDWPIDYGRVSVTLKTHRFPLGASLRTRPQSRMSSANYLWYLKAAAEHFWSGSIASQLQWSQYEPQPGEVGNAKKAVDDLLGWTRAQEWSDMEALLFDGAHSAPDHWSAKLGCKDLEAQLRERLMRDLTHYTGRLVRYEVWRGALGWRELIDRCGEGFYFDAFRWAHAADPAAMLLTSEVDVLNTQTLTRAEAYHNLVYRMISQGVPVGGVGLQARFEGEVDASTVKHRLDVMSELKLPIYITDLAIAGLDASKHAYELEKFLRIAFSHPAVAGISLGELWDEGNPLPGSGLYSTTKEPKPAVQALERLWREEWHTTAEKPMGSEGSIEFDAFSGTYAYELRSRDRVCMGTVELDRPSDEDLQRIQREAGSSRVEPKVFMIQCDWAGHVHVPVWATPAAIALIFVGTLLTCFRQRRELMHSVGASNKGNLPIRRAPRDYDDEN
tara:strand:+ start:255 stop:3833 length:3579 start_codon:yes stop_codon:yes gene_type:complete